MKKRKISLIALKFSIIVSVLILVVMSIMASLILQQTRQSFIKEMEIRAQFFARETRESLFPKPDPFRLYFAVQEMVKEKAVLYAMVLDEKGKILSDFAIFQETNPVFIGEAPATPAPANEASATGGVTLAS